MAELHNNTIWKHADKDLADGSAQVISILQGEGHEAFWVGGCVRDEYMGRTVNDMDITTNALPEVTLSLFEKVIPTGMKHGTVTVLMHGHAYEVTTYRIEKGYEDHRRPSEVEFVDDIEKDLRRRDFTMNAMALAMDGRFVDPFGGRSDIDDRLIRCVGDPKVRFQEDALRMIRCIRFASNFGFMIAKDTWAALLEQRSTLGWVAMERIRTELDKLMSGPDPLRGLELIREGRLYEHVKVPFPYRGHQSAYISAIPAVGMSSPEQVDVRYALLLLGCRIPSSTPLLRQWTFSNRRMELIKKLLQLQEAWTENSEGLTSEQARLLWIRCVLIAGEPIAALWLELQQAVQTAGGTPAVDIPQARAWLSGMPVKSLRELALTGDGLLSAVGRRGGPWMKPLLSHLLLLAASGQVGNDTTLLIEEAKRVIIDEGI
ncbi:CCA tRNA nucleotidyltransferase [Paenibacillus sp. F411]|uniref:CCA tRNA nucleotidyltransferase n=1 Tax=Paenibacillus sp. F411 TaxID=2820239 RepID=UPI001AAE38E5|nr:CCA tRNA nucleotidyltransferase [Paenibacillus sp. F411]MBO2943150.1 CCA tRNA nucleotidyltransferase [Paenibacillus sp. F411]